MNAILRVGILVYFSINLLLGQSWRMDTTWVSGEGENWDLMISQPDGYFPYYSNGKCIVGAHVPNACGIFPYLFYFDTREKPIVARPIPFTGFPEEIFKDSRTGGMHYFMDRFFEIPGQNRIVWHSDQFLTVTDTNLHFIKRYFEPVIWKKKRDSYHSDMDLHITEKYYIRFIGGYFHRKDFHGKKEGITRFGKFMAPKLSENQFAGIGRMNIQALLDSQEVKIKQEKIDLFDYCDTVRSRWTLNRYATYLDSNEVLWFMDDFSRNIVRYELNTGNQKCFSLMEKRADFFPAGEYDFLPQARPLNEKREYDFNKMNYSDFGTKIEKINKGRVGNLEDFYICVDESKDVLFRAYYIVTKDSILKNALIPYCLSVENLQTDSKTRSVFWVGEYRKLSTMEITRIGVLPFPDFNLLQADAESFTLFKAMWDGDVRKFGLVRCTYSD